MILWVAAGWQPVASNPATPQKKSLARCPASIGPDRQRDEDDEDTNAPGDCLPDRRGIGLIEEEPTYRVDD